MPLRCTSGSGAGTSLVSACGGGGGGGGAGKFSHLIEYTSLPSSGRLIGAQLSTRAVAPLGNNFVCAHAGDAIKRMANASFFIGFSRETCRSASIEADWPKEVHRGCWLRAGTTQPICLPNN